MSDLLRVLVRCIRAGDCLEWIGARNKANGYGIIWVGHPRKRMYAHRVVASAMGLAIDGLEVMHKCDNPSCCNPAHLSVGTRSDNVRDAISKGRFALPPRTDWQGRITGGVDHHWQKLSVDQVAEIRRRLNAGEKQASIANDFGVTFQQISKIKRRQRWAYV